MQSLLCKPVAFRPPILIAALDGADYIDLGVEAIYVRGNDKAGRIAEVIRDILKEGIEKLQIGYVETEDIDLYAKSKGVGPAELYLSPSLEKFRAQIERSLFWGENLPAGL